MRGGIATLLGILSGILVIVGVLIGGLLGGIFDLLSSNGRGLVSLLYSGLIDMVLGFLILVFTGYARSHPPPDKAGGGVVLVILSVIVWVITGGVFYVLVVIGAILGLLAGVLFLLESAFRAPPR